LSRKAAAPRERHGMGATPLSTTRRVADPGMNQKEVNWKPGLAFC
jgi:hypothetical protein